MRRSILCTLFVLMAVASFAKDHPPIVREKSYSRGFDEVWAACVQTANEQNKIDIMDKSAGVLRLKQTAWGSGQLPIAVTIVKASETETKVTMSFPHMPWMATKNKNTDRAAMNFLGIVEAKLSQNP